MVRRTRVDTSELREKVRTYKRMGGLAISLTDLTACLEEIDRLRILCQRIWLTAPPGLSDAILDELGEVVRS
jgi:hypothetical protein